MKKRATGKSQSAKLRLKNSKPASKATAKSTEAQFPNLPIGLEASVERVVEFQWTIAAYNPDLPAIFSTPAMIGLMEVAAAESIRPHLPPGHISVGTRIEVDHLKAVPQGKTVRANARYIGNEGRFLIFEVQVRSGDVLIGRGQVRRTIVPLPTNP
ncbi:MAG TPA: hotdog domain-containing protein [Candidatus Acidoferrales bacterium]|nr:hotdog domain-containing protein [Candidatus Acidoferrales bacterium]